MRHEVVGLGLAQTLLDCTLHPHQTRAELVLCKLTHTPHAAVAEVIDVIDLTATVAQLHQHLDGVEDVLVGEGHRAEHLFTAEAAVELHAADLGEVVGILTEEEPVKECLDSIFRGRLARTHHAIDGHPSRELVGCLIEPQGRGNIGAMVEVVDVEGRELAHLGVAHLGKQFFSNLIVGLGHQFARLWVDEVGGHHTAQKVVVRYGDAL